MLGKTEILDTSPTGQGVPVPITQLSLQETAGPRGSRQCGPRGITALAPQLWIDPLSLTGPFVQSGHCATIWTGPRAE